MTDLPTFTREQIDKAVNAGADLVLDGVDIGEQDRDLVNLVVNAAMTLLENPEASLDDVMNECYGGGAAEVRSWWSDWGGSE